MVTIARISKTLNLAFVLTCNPKNIGASVSKVEPRTKIAATGILAALDRLQNLNSGDENIINQAKIEFLNACLLADMHTVVEQQLLASPGWPLPHPQRSPGVTVQHVLRYYYLRGVVHTHCRNWRLAVRCFWTCLSVPSSEGQNVVSAIAVAAWKKLVLVQCILADSLEHIKNTNTATTTSRSNIATAATTNAIFGSPAGETLPPLPRSGPMSLPHETPTSLLRFLHNASIPPGSRSISDGSVPPPRRSGSNNSDSPITTPTRRLARPPELEAQDDAAAMHLVEYDASDVMAMVGLVDRPNHGNNNNINNNRMPSLGVRVYRELVQAFLAVDRPAFDSIVQEYESLFRADGHYGLIVGPVATTLLHRQVYTVGSLYSTLPLSKLATELKLPSVADAQALLDQLATLKQKHWPVTVERESGDDDDAIVVFPEQPPLSSEDGTGLMTADELLQLTHTVRELDTSVQSSRKFAAQVMRRNKTASDKSKDAAAAPRGVEDI